MRSELIASLSEGEAKAVEFGVLELELYNLKEQLNSSNTLLQESVPRSELLSFQTNVAALFQEFKAFAFSFRHEAKLLMTQSISRIDEILSDPEICRPTIINENVLSEENINITSTKHHTMNQAHLKLGSAPPLLNDDLISSDNQFDEKSMSEENLDIVSDISTGESVIPPVILQLFLSLSG